MSVWPSRAGLSVLGLVKRARALAPAGYWRNPLLDRNDPWPRGADTPFVCYHPRSITRGRPRHVKDVFGTEPKRYARFQYFSSLAMAVPTTLYFSVRLPLTINASEFSNLSPPPTRNAAGAAVYFKLQI
jgi:hypothetical protein